MSEDGIPAAPRKKQRLPGGLTGNALTTGIICVLLSGLVSYTVARWQAQDAAKQATNAQQTTAVIQLEAAAGTFYQGTLALLESCYKTPSLCPNPPAQNPWYADQATFHASLDNITDQQATRIATQLGNDAAFAIDDAGTEEDTPTLWFESITLAYHELIDRLGQLARSQ